MLDIDRSTINIVTTCDNAYVQHTAVFLKSLLDRNPDIKCRIFILVPNNFIHLVSLERNLGRFGKSLELVNTDLSEALSLKISDHVTIATYFRLLLDRLLPGDIDRIIYMDSDVLVTGPLASLWATDLENYAVAATIDSVVDRDPSVREKVGLAPTSHYFNAGVLLIDLCRWRNEELGERALAFAIEHPELITWWDQCALNHVLRGRFKQLANEWNFQTAHLRWSKDGMCTADSLRELDAAKIIHFTGDLKPWHDLSAHPMKWLYWKYLRETDWRSYWPPDRPRRSVLIRGLEKRAPALLNAARWARTLCRRIVG